MKAYLGLTDTQLQALQQLIPLLGDAKRQVQNDIERKQASLRDLLQKGPTDAAAVGGLMLDIEALRRRMEQLRSVAQVQARATLTDAQKAKLKALEDTVALGGEIHEATVLFLPSPPAPMFGPGFGTPGPLAPRGVPRMRR